eukprot:CAMPEP_0181177846 /NCGR_PEP_ID=MMETSP1096-20121128/5392_1 /TAXON_ID=156174 ORGANISM="Chrysochromulina ericina, Strain CCMP281" /NCGR_SAMPLE_ID=MMETSP1096 /ASSEMBLY_ACC=CAM_ASM_000453 /LENGTH=81 /DNA_ID=CAMNT_0023266051 /DNA_START=728 /DNA_END=973 /DNA_ORIENTATION=+
MTLVSIPSTSGSSGLWSHPNSKRLSFERPGAQHAVSQVLQTAGAPSPCCSGTNTSGSRSSESRTCDVHAGSGSYQAMTASV